MKLVASHFNRRIDAVRDAGGFEWSVANVLQLITSALFPLPSLEHSFYCMVEEQEQNRLAACRGNVMAWKLCTLPTHGMLSRIRVVVVCQGVLD